MQCSSWLRRRTPSPAPRKRPTFRPRLEALEGRFVPSTTWIVNTTADSGPGSLRQAILNAAPGGDTIDFAPSSSPQTINLSSGELLINKSLTINGPGASQLSINGGGLSRVFEVAGGVQATLAGLTITGGDGHAAVVGASRYDNSGGAILNWGTLTVSSSTVSGSSANETGGGIYSAGTLTVSNSIVSGNTAYRAGGIYSSGTATLTGCTLTNNTGSGGFPSFFLWGTSMAWQFGGGGGIWNDATLTISGCTLSANYAGGGAGGGGIYNGGSLTVSGSTLSGNSALEYGGGIYNDQGAGLTLQKSTVTQNTVSYLGADLYNLGWYTSKGSKIG
jgi:hypothetical protein